MRKAAVMAALLILILVACAETPDPTLPPLPTAAPTPTDTVPAPTAAPTTTTSLDIEPTPLPSSPTPTDTSTVAPAAESRWPTFLRELDFGVPAGNTYGPRALAVHPGLGRLYIRTRTQGLAATGLVTMMDLSSGQVLAVTETGSDTYSEGDLAVDTVRDRLYAANPRDSTCSILDADTLEPINKLEGVDQLALDVENSRLYIVGAVGLRVLDATSYDTLDEISLPPAQTVLDLAVDSRQERVLLVTQVAGSYSLSQYKANVTEPLAVTSLPGRLDDLAPDPSRGRTYITLNDGEQSLLWTLSDDGGVVEERRLGEWTQHTYLALDPAGDRLFLGRDAYHNYGITVLDLETDQQIGDIQLERGPNALAWDGETGQLFASHTYAHQISVVDVDQGQVSGLFLTAIELVDLAVDPGRRHLYVTDTAGWLHIVDSETDDEIAALPAEGHIALDSPHGRLYTGGGGADHVRVFDLNRLQQRGEIRTRAKPVADAYNGRLYLVRNGVYLTSQETMTITGVISDTLPKNPGFSPNPSAVDAVVDPGSGRVFAVINNGVPGSNNGNYLYVYEPGTYQKVLTDTERSPIYLDVDPTTGRAYVSRTHLAGRSSSLLDAQDGSEYIARLEAIFGALRVDPDMGRVFLTARGHNDSYLFVLEAGDLDVLTTVPIPDGFWIRALDPQQHLLYLARQNGRVQIWSATGGDLPAAAPVPADLAAEGASRLLLPPGDLSLFALDTQQFLYRSDEGRDSWERLHGGLPSEWVWDVAFSPDFARDQTLFASLATGDQGFGVWKSTNSGQNWHMTSIGLTDLAVTDLIISPGFAEDQTLFATASRGGLFRSTDAGQTWMPLTERYRPPDAFDEPPDQVALSPTYAEDQTLFLSHYGLQRSADGGDTWQEIRVAPKPPGFGFDQVAILPGTPGNRVFYLWVPTEPDQLTQLFVSTDDGDTWTASVADLPLAGYGAGRLFAAPDSSTLYFIWTPSDLDASSQVFRITGDFTGWERLTKELYPAATPVELTSDGSAFVALDDAGRVIRWPLTDLTWQPAIPPTPVPTDGPTPIPPATRTPTPAACASEPVRFRAVWQQARTRLGCPEHLAEQVRLAEQPFEYGCMIWNSSSLQIYVLSDEGTWQAFDDTFREGVDPDYDPDLPPPPRQPQRGFGKVWREQLGGAQAAVGWALEGERPVDGWRQRFEWGLLVWTDAVLQGEDIAGSAYLLYDDGTWQAFPAAAP